MVALVQFGAFWRLWFPRRPQAACFHQESPPEGNLSAQTLHITPITKNTLSSALYLTGSVAFSGGPHAAAEGVFCHLPVVGGSPQLRDIRHPADSSSVLPDSPPRLRCGVRAKVVLLHLFCSLCDNAGGGHQRGLEPSEEATANKAAAAPDEETGFFRVEEAACKKKAVRRRRRGGRWRTCPSACTLTCTFAPIFASCQSAATFLEV